MNVIMMNDNLLIKKHHKDYTKTSGGILLQNQEKPKTVRATVISVGEGKRSFNGDIIPTSITVGDEIEILTNIGTEIQIKDEKFYVITEAQVFLIHGEKKYDNV